MSTHTSGERRARPCPPFSNHARTTPTGRTRGHVGKAPRQVSVSGSLRQCGICAACLLRRMSVHAAGTCEVRETYVWENLSATRFEDGAAPAFMRRAPTGALHEYAIAGVLHLDHLANLRRFPICAAAIGRQAYLLDRSLGLDERDTQTKLEGMLQRHEEEWRGFIDFLGPRSFVAQWIARGH